MVDLVHLVVVDHMVVELVVELVELAATQAAATPYTQVADQQVVQD